MIPCDIADRTEEGRYSVVQGPYTRGQPAGITRDESSYKQSAAVGARADLVSSEQRQKWIETCAYFARIHKVRHGIIRGCSLGFQLQEAASRGQQNSPIRYLMKT